MKNTSWLLTVCILAFGCYYLLSELFFADLYRWLVGLLQLKPLSFLITYLLVGLPIFAGVLLLHPARQLFFSLGLDKNPLRALAVALIATLPMLIGYAIVFAPDPAFSWLRLFTGVLCAAFFEELYFRGFLFGQIYRFTSIGFLPAILIGALLFAFGHLYQSTDPATMTGIFFTTFLGAGLFAWVYVEWDYNLWCAIWLHLLMNLFWMIFSAGDNAFGGIFSNVFRVMSIALVIGGTIVYKKRKGLPLTVTRNTLWIKKKYLTR